MLDVAAVAVPRWEAMSRAEPSVPSSLPPTSPTEATAGHTSPLAYGTQPMVRVDGDHGAVAAAVSELVELEGKLDRCLAGLHMYFQPIVFASDRRRFGYETLLRSRDRSFPHPGAILDAAERLERIPLLGRAIRAQVAQVLAAEPPTRGVVFLNLHLLDLLDRGLTSPFSPLSKVASRVILEITERTSLDGHVDLRYRVAELRELGFRIAIDDLGGGHARMRTLTPLDTDFLKLDMSLVRDCDKHPLKQRLIGSITELCRDQGLQVIGEGVETEAEAKALVDLGCDLLQGYLIAKPAPPFCDAL
jgi:EAL domain-containing protein (putative c-di-GMP-specific phosphodiesterase class I)